MASTSYETASLTAGPTRQPALQLIGQRVRGYQKRVVGRRAFAFAKVAISMLFLLEVVRQVSANDFFNQVAHARLRPLSAALLLLLVQFPLAGWRWRLVLRACNVDASAWRLQNLVWIGQFINQFMPTFLIGDAVRGWYLTREKVPVQAAFSSLVLDRFAGLAGLLLVILLMSPIVFAEVGSTTASAITGFAGIGLGAAVLGVFGCMALLRAKVLSRWPRIEAQARDAWRMAANLPRLALIIIFVTGTNVIASLAAYFVAVSFGVDLSLPSALALVPVALFAVLMPISVAGWGVREGTLVFLLGLVGIPPAQGLIVSVAYGIVTIGAAVPGGLLWLRERMAGET